MPHTYYMNWSSIGYAFMEIICILYFEIGVSLRIAVNHQKKRPQKSLKAEKWTLTNKSHDAHAGQNHGIFISSSSVKRDCVEYRSTNRIHQGLTKPSFILYILVPVILPWSRSSRMRQHGLTQICL